MSSMNPTLREMHEDLSVGEDFVNRYNRPGPRYTSYPTAPVWTDSYGPADFETAMQSADDAYSTSPARAWLRRGSRRRNPTKCSTRCRQNATSDMLAKGSGLNQSAMAEFKEGHHGLLGLLGKFHQSAYCQQHLTCEPPY